MEYFTTDLHGVTLINPGPDERKRILESVQSGEPADFPEVYLSIDQGPVLGYRTGGYLTWEEDGEVVRLLKEIEVDEAERIWNRILEGDLESVNRLPWERI